MSNQIKKEQLEEDYKKTIKEVEADIQYEKEYFELEERIQKMISQFEKYNILDKNDKIEFGNS